MYFRARADIWSVRRFFFALYEELTDYSPAAPPGSRTVDDVLMSDFHCKVRKKFVIPGETLGNFQPRRRFGPYKTKTSLRVGSIAARAMKTRGKTSKPPPHNKIVRRTLHNVAPSPSYPIPPLLFPYSSPSPSPFLLVRPTLGPPPILPCPLSPPSSLPNTSSPLDPPTFPPRPASPTLRRPLPSGGYFFFFLRSFCQ